MAVTNRGIGPKTPDVSFFMIEIALSKRSRRNPEARRSRLAEGLHQALRDSAEQLFRLQVERRFHEPRIASGQNQDAEASQSASETIQHGPDDRLGGHAPGELVEVALDDDGGGFLVHCQSLPKTYCILRQL
jgi:hypothetical protein